MQQIVDEQILEITTHLLLTKDAMASGAQNLTQVLGAENEILNKFNLKGTGV